MKIATVPRRRFVVPLYIVHRHWCSCYHIDGGGIGVNKVRSGAAGFVLAFNSWQ